MASGAVLSPELARVGSLLLHQQCWCWGCDIRRPEGNLLLQYGFVRLRPPRPDSGSSRYTLRIGDRTKLHLWGFGAAWQEGEDATFVARYEFQPVMLRKECLAGDIWVRDQLFFHSPEPRRQWKSLAHAACFSRFNAGYERWVLRTAGLAYRREVLAQWDHFSVSAEEFAAAWECLADLLDGLRDALQQAAARKPV
jgi:hypothetical protein